ncbi:MAG: 50S ribosomal protein L25 [Patescibacteria group bacterium]|nr:50S ribosomal protein L25 [Patescibacteria group bacterium]
MALLTAKTRKPDEAAEPMNGREPIKGVVYGNGIPSVSLNIGPSDFLHLFREVKYSSLFDLVIDDAEPVKAIIQEVQVHPVTMNPIHIDFRQIRMDQPITVEVPLVFVGESDAVKMGGTLIKNLDEVEIECLPAKLPKELVVDLSVLKTYEDRIVVSSLQVPEGVALHHDAEELIAAVEEPLSEEEQKKLEEQDIGDVTAVKSEADEKKEGEEAAATDEAGNDKKE